MMRILSWSSGLGSDKMHPSDFNVFAPKQELISVVGPSLLVSTKRKRSPSCDEQSTQLLFDTTANKRINRTCLPISPMSMPDSLDSQCQHVNNVTPTSCSQSTDTISVGQASAAARPLTEMQLQSMRQTISTQLNLEILVKHKELRLVDQEIAKCQVALEQLRRCTEIPFPATQQPSVLVSAGQGTVIRKSERFPPESPAPWGVVDGPYTRHYAQWLLPDRHFDGGEPETPNTQATFNSITTGRSTRGHVVDVYDSKGMKSRSQRGNLQSLPAGYGQPKEKATGPMILKRKSDGVMVKLVCPDCGRHDFGSAQGFINHCRIGHGRSFASHDAAAEACGEAVEYNDNGTVKGVEPVITPTTGNVHPLIRSAKLVGQTPTASPKAFSRGYLFTPVSISQRSNQPKATAINFHGSSDTPHLSALIKNQGLGLNLQDLVSEAKLKVISVESEDDMEDVETESPVVVNTGRHPQIAGSKQPVKSVSTDPSPLSNSRMRFDETLSNHNRSVPARSMLHAVHTHQDSFHALLPSPTNESTQAPSLVDDDEEYEAQSPSSSDELDEHDIDFDVHDDERGDPETSLRSTEPAVPQATCASAPSAAPTCHGQAMAHNLATRTDDGYVSFASPSPAPEASQRKKRRIGEKP